MHTAELVEVMAVAVAGEEKKLMRWDVYKTVKITQNAQQHIQIYDTVGRWLAGWLVCCLHSSTCKCLLP